MPSNWFHRRHRDSADGASRRLLFERCEDRRMLTVMADVLFVVDESASVVAQGSTNAIAHDWLDTIVPLLESGSFENSLANKGIDDIRYGLVGFGEFVQNTTTPKFAHSQLLASDDIYGNSDDLDSAIPSLAEFGGFEDGWDALEHAIAEYNFREDAVPVFVLVQNEEGRVSLNDTLTRDGIFAALRSKNAILHVMVVGDNEILPNGSSGSDSIKLVAFPSRALAA